MTYKEYYSSSLVLLIDGTPLDNSKISVFALPLLELPDEAPPVDSTEMIGTDLGNVEPTTTKPPQMTSY